MNARAGRRGWLVASRVLLLVLAGAACADAAAIPEPPSGSVEDPDLAAAIAASVSAVRAAPDDAGVWADLAATYDANFFDALAEEAYRRALALRDGDARAWYGLAHVLERQGRYDEAVAAARRAEEIAPDYPPLPRTIALWALARGHLDEAEKAAARALETSNGGAGAWIAAGRVALERGDVAAAEEAFREAVERWPPDWGPPSYARFLRGNALRRLGRVDDAAAELAHARDAEPRLPDPWRGEVMARRDGFDVRLDRAHRLLMADRFAEAAASLEALRARKPRHEQVLSDLGTVHLLTGRWDEAIRVLEECVAAHPGSVEPRLQLARGLWASGRREQAMRHADEAIRVDPGSADAFEARGMLRLRAGDAAAALADLRRAESLDPKNVLAAAYAGAASLELGRADDAEVAFARAIALDPSQPTALAGRAILRMRAGDLVAADVLLAAIAPYADDAAPLIAEARRERATASHPR